MKRLNLLFGIVCWFISSVSIILGKKGGLFCAVVSDVNLVLAFLQKEVRK